MQDVDGKLKDFQEKQNIDIGLIMGRGHNNASLVSDKMPVLPRANIMRMGATRSLSVSTSLHNLTTAAAWLYGSMIVHGNGRCQSLFRNELLLRFASLALLADAVLDGHQLPLLVRAVFTQPAQTHQTQRCPSRFMQTLSQRLFL